MRLRAGALVSVPAGEVLFVGWALAIENYGIRDWGFGIRYYNCFRPSNP